jgi:hypothetical protein
MAFPVTVLEKNAPMTILLSDREKVTIINDLPIVDTGALPGYMVEMFNDTSVTPNRLAWRKASAAAGQASMFVLLERDILNVELGAAYPSGELAQVAGLLIGTKWWGWVNSGQNITQGDYVQNNGDGTMKSATATTAAANVAKNQSLDTLGAVTVPTRVTLRRIQ